MAKGKGKGKKGGDMSEPDNVLLNDLWSNIVETEITDEVNYPNSFLTVLKNAGESLTPYFSDHWAQIITANNLRIGKNLPQSLKLDIKARLREYPLFSGVLISSYLKLDKIVRDPENSGLSVSMEEFASNKLNTKILITAFKKAEPEIRKIVSDATAKINPDDFPKYFESSYTVKQIRDGSERVSEEIIKNHEGTRDTIGTIIKEKYKEIPDKLIHTLKHLAEENKLSLSEILNKKTLVDLMRGNPMERSLVDRILGKHMDKKATDNLRVPYDFTKYYKNKIRKIPRQNNPKPGTPI